MSKGKKHWARTFYKQPCEFEGYKFPPKMIRLSKFAEIYHYSREELETLLRDKHLFGKTFKKSLYVCPCPTSHLWNSAVIQEFWIAK